MQNPFENYFFSGLSGLQLDVPKYLYPQPYENASRLTYYASIFNSIEFNSSFYKIPQPSTVAKWTTLVSDEFRFTFKLWKEITHNKRLNFIEEDIRSFFTSVNAVGFKKGCLLIQFPPSLDKSNIAQLSKLLSLIKFNEISQGWNLAVEFRNKSWYHEDVYDLLDYYNTSLVFHDIPQSATPLINHNSDFLYFRFHGPSGNYRDSYSDDFLNEYSAYINERMEEGKTVYVYFNNTMGDALNNLKSLNQRIKDKYLWYNN